MTTKLISKKNARDAIASSFFIASALLLAIAMSPYGANIRKGLVLTEASASLDPHIDVKKQGSGSFEVIGSGFEPNKKVVIRVLDPASLGNYFGYPWNWPSVTSDKNGHVDTSFQLPTGCLSVNVGISATDNKVAPNGDPVYSNTVHSPCV